MPVLGLREELLLRSLALGSVVAGCWFWTWWLVSGHGEWTTPAIGVTVLLAWAFALPAYFFFFICRMTRPNPARPVPALRAAMVVTKVPAEPWPLVRATLEAMLAQELADGAAPRHRTRRAQGRARGRAPGGAPGGAPTTTRAHDTWLADECPSETTLRWCLEHGVKVSSRFGVAEYHQPCWPRRTRSKEGNLAYFYDTVGYRSYDVVVQLDADHVPAPGYLEAMLRPFADPKVGYVAGPSICDSNVEEGWTVRGRLYREASMHGPVQAGCNGGWAPVCIGSHYAVRTAALRAVGGLGPELAEDYSTTLWLQSGGWAGVFSIDAEAHGEGPPTVEEMLLQERQWARSLSTILVRWAPGRLRRAPLRARVRLGFALLFYPLQTAALLGATVAPIAGVVFATSWGQTSLAGFYLHLWPSSVVTVATIAYLRRRHLLRPRRAKLWSWELLLFQLVRWPWVLVGIVEGAYAGVRSRVVTFKVTPKTDGQLKALSVRAVAPCLVLGAVPAWVVVAEVRGASIGLVLVTALQAVTYLLCAVAVVALHLVGNHRRLLRGGRASIVGPPAGDSRTPDIGR